MKTIYDLKLHEGVQARTDLYVTRVPGGWIYESLELGIVVASVFIPFNDEFKQT